MEQTPIEFTRRYLIEHTEYSLSSVSYQWRAWMRHQIVLLDLAGTWNSKGYPHYFSEFWSIFCERNQEWSRVYFVIDITGLQIQDEAFRTYVKNSWFHLVEREDLVICFVEAREMKRVIRLATRHLLGIQDRVRVVANHQQALDWVRGCVAATLA